MNPHLEGCVQRDAKHCSCGYNQFLAVEEATAQAIAAWLEALSYNRACPEERRDWYRGVADDIRVGGPWKEHRRVTELRRQAKGPSMSFSEAARLDARDSTHDGKIDVIVEVRRRTRCGLKAAKDACEDTNFDVEKAVELVLRNVDL